MTNRFLSLGCLLAAALLLGCDSASSIPKADVSGVVTLNGKPWADVEVNFVNDDSGFAGYGKTDSEGRFALVQGAAIGSNRVFFSKLSTMEGFDPDPESGMDEGQLEAAGGFETSETLDPKMSLGQQVPAEFTAENSKLTFEVTAAGATDADFKLTSSD